MPYFELAKINKEVINSNLGMKNEFRA